MLPETHCADASATFCRRLRRKCVRGGARNVVVGAAVYVVGVCLPLAFVTGLEVDGVQQFVDYRFLKRLFRRKVSVDGNYKVVVCVTFCAPALVACAVVGAARRLAEVNRCSYGHIQRGKFLQAIGNQPFYVFVYVKAVVRLHIGTSLPHFCAENNFQRLAFANFLQAIFSVGSPSRRKRMCLK